MENTTGETQVQRSSIKRMNPETLKNIEKYSKSPELISGRIRELEKEWDVEKSLEFRFSVLGLLGVILAVTVSIWWILLPTFVLSLLCLHALLGIPVVIFSKRRSKEEIDEELYALKVVRGDFRFFHGVHEVIEAIKKH